MTQLNGKVKEKFLGWNEEQDAPISTYAKNLFRTVSKQYRKLENDPSGYEEFITKRMNLPKVDMEK